MSSKIKVHIADDHKILIDGLVALLDTEDRIIVEGFSLTGKELIDSFSSKNVDVLILDVNMPELDGIAVLKYFQEHNIKHKTIVLSSHDDPKLVQELMALGANGFVEKGLASEAIIQAVLKVSAGELYYSDGIKDRLLNLYVNSSVSSNAINSIVNPNLTNREEQILRLIALERTTQEISEELQVSLKTIEADRRKLYKKLRVKNMVGLAMYAIKNNLV